MITMAISITQIFIAVALLFAFASGDGFVRFRKQSGVSMKDTEVATMNPPKNWYASWPTKYRLLLVGTFSFEFTMDCTVENLEGDNELTMMRFCFYQLGQKADSHCQRLTPTSRESRIKVNPSDDSSPYVELHFNPVTGGFARIKSASKNAALTSMFFCEATNRMGSIRSNNIQFIDERKQYPTALPKVPTRKLVFHKDGPVKVPCLSTPLNLPDGDQVKYSWAICDMGSGGTKFSDCTSQTNIMQLESKWPLQILKDGSLYIPYFPPTGVSQMTGQRLICFMYNFPTVFYVEKIQFTDAPSPSKVSTLVMTQPKGTEKVTLLDSSETKQTYSCNFEIGKGDYAVKWKHIDSKGKSVNLMEGANIEFKVFVKKHTITFTGPFTERTPGTYTCEVTWRPPGGSEQAKSGSYKIELKYYPKTSDKMVPKKFVVAGRDGVVECLYRNPFRSSPIAGMQVRPTLGINGLPLSVESEDKLKADLVMVNSKFSTVMSGLDIQVTPLSPNPGQVLKYTAKKMFYKNPMNSLSSSHQMQCIGTNDVASVRMSVQLQVVPEPVLDTDGKPANLNCSECSATQEHVIKCVITNREEFNKSGVVFKQFWKLGNSKINDLTKVPNAAAKKYLIVSDDEVTLTVKKIDNEKFKKSVNEAGKISCVITLGYPTTMKFPEGVRTSGPETGVFYNSESDMKINKELETSIKLTKIAVKPRAAGAMWIIPVAMACIVILIVIALIVVCCKKRNVGETYNVDEKEKQQGNDPEAENAEKEAFPIFERPEDGPIRGSRASLDDSIQVGSDDEDEVLAEYDVDIGKFDEEGSFIGQYATSDGPAGGQPGARRLPQVANNTEV